MCVRVSVYSRIFSLSLVFDDGIRGGDLEKQATFVWKESDGKRFGMQVASMSAHQLRGQFLSVGGREEEVWRTGKLAPKSRGDIGR